MKDIGAQLLVKTVQGLAEGTLQETPQSSIVNRQSSETEPPLTTHHPIAIGSPLTIEGQQTLKHAPKIFTDTCKIDWTKAVEEIHNLIRGLSPFPGAFTELGDKMIKIFRSEKELLVPTSRPGRWESDKNTYLKFACKDGYIHLKDVQLEGKKRMVIEEFLRGYRF
jgi:methionyl-tRNA formyltransferase